MRLTAKPVPAVQSGIDHEGPGPASAPVLGAEVSPPATVEGLGKEGGRDQGWKGGKEEKKRTVRKE